jgi:hypothetical protein
MIIACEHELEELGAGGIVGAFGFSASQRSASVSNKKTSA